MFGNHDYETAVKIAAEKTAETGKNHIVVEAETDSGKPIKGKYTIGVPIKGMNGTEFKEMLMKRFSATQKKD